MLDAAVPGAIFASPSMIQVKAATEAIDRGLGVVHVVKNYTGDVINFGLARDLAIEEGLAVETVIVDDDLATDGSPDDGPGRRGTLGEAVEVANDSRHGLSAYIFSRDYETVMDTVDALRFGEIWTSTGRSASRSTRTAPAMATRASGARTASGGCFATPRSRPPTTTMVADNAGARRRRPQHTRGRRKV
jgi:hypothetical protein